MDFSTEPIGLAACLVMGGAVTIFIFWLLRSLATDDLEQDDEWRYDVSRINGLRRSDPVFRLFQPLIQTAARFNRNVFGGELPELGRQIQAAGMSRYWLAEEYLGKLELISILLLPVYALSFVATIGGMGVLTAFIASGMTFWVMKRQIKRRAERRLILIKRRMPYLLDLLTLLMEAGSSFIHALQQAVHEFARQPVAEEFGRVLADMNMGKARSEAFDSIRRRLDDDEINSIIAAILQSEELGTPITSIFRTQAEVLRVKRSQRAEKIAGEAGVNMLLPGVLVMASTVLLILGPFVLNYVVLGMGL
ncbi:MAG: type II secretion system F family protein [Planctomycetota bacterium]|jgi:tight adherence protein C|nr:type II secretion system F family protein [Planctomycetota bacterium]MEC7354091.1 type II secretion system F family protein [Planctomycetota bacterium]MEC7428940.1 type II secretion system F family protein [Planctomycetota bacterium]MEC7448677.1 type II secretion system F family protein [Planctomycetota bacterium]MEC7497437.1 type II secretion system F family protein [Planctomycetota bacterium]